MEVSLGQETLITLSTWTHVTIKRYLGVFQVLKRTPESMIILAAIFKLKSSLLTASNELVVPGVDGSASILLGKRSVLEYVLEPMISSLRGALSE